MRPGFYVYGRHSGKQTWVPPTKEHTGFWDSPILQIGGPFVYLDIRNEALIAAINAGWHDVTWKELTK